MSSLGLGLSESEEQERQRRHRRRGRRAVGVALVVVLLLVLGVVGAGFFALRGLIPHGGAEDYPGPGTGRVQVEVDSGATLTAIGQTLAKADVVASVGAFVDAAKANPEAAGVQPGIYALKQKMKASDAVSLLLDPTSRVQEKVLLREGLRLKESLQAIAKATDIPLDDLQAAAKDPASLGAPDWAPKGSLEGFVFPATYTFKPGVKAQDVLAAAVKRFDQAAQDTGLGAGATIDGKRYTPLQILTVASIAEKEAPPADQAKVARVLYNRLDKGMKLQLDSTVSYATGKPGITTSDQDRASTSPYNTYVHAGLPPGPIDSPGENAIKAALNPADGPWLYFVTVNPDTGETKFAVTGAEHQKNVAEFQKWLREHPGQ
jgi:UPF0755 protein